MLCEPSNLSGKKKKTGHSLLLVVAVYRHRDYLRGDFPSRSAGGIEAHRLHDPYHHPLHSCHTSIASDLSTTHSGNIKSKAPD